MKLKEDICYHGYYQVIFCKCLYTCLIRDDNILTNHDI